MQVNAVRLYASVFSYVEFVLSLFFRIPPSFVAAKRLCFMIVAFTGYVYLYFFNILSRCNTVNYKHSDLIGLTKLCRMRI